MDQNAGYGTERQRVGHHGGDLEAARKLFPAAPEPWLDLSTGINPSSYPVGSVEPSAWRRLPGAAEMAALEAGAARAYGAEPRNVIAAPGTQALIQLLPRLLAARRVGLLGFTYGEHERAWAAAGAKVEIVTELDALAGCDVAVVVNPNNPDGRLVEPVALAKLAAQLRRRDGLLVVDEAFMDVIRPSRSLVPLLPDGTVVLRSFGKTYGLAGLRLGFAVAPPRLACLIRAALGPWPVSGPAIAIGAAALGDAAWLRAAVNRLETARARLDGLLRGAGLTIVGGTPLFGLAGSLEAPVLFERLARRGILTRPFGDRPDWLRFGLCDGEAAWDRLARALHD